MRNLCRILGNIFARGLSAFGDILYLRVCTFAWHFAYISTVHVSPAMGSIWLCLYILRWCARVIGICADKWGSHSKVILGYSSQAKLGKSGVGVCRRQNHGGLTIVVLGHGYLYFAFAHFASIFRRSMRHVRTGDPTCLRLHIFALVCRGVIRHI